MTNGQKHIQNHRGIFLSTHSLYPMWQLLNNSGVFDVSGTDWAFSHESLNYKVIPPINNKQVNLN